MDLLKRKHNHIILHNVFLGEKKVQIPVAHVGGDGERIILITAGMDGDEYAGIEAAYQLINHFQKAKPKDRIIIIPIVNIPGFENQMSKNPFDDSYPKHIFPGRKNGSSTQQLMFWLSENFVKNVDLWIDLHSGASTEILDPYVQVWLSYQRHVNNSLLEKIRKIKADRVIVDSRQRMFVETIAKRKTAYILLESGQLGQRNKVAIKQHVDWVKQLLTENSSRRTSFVRTIKKQIYMNVCELVAQKDGIWVPLFLGKTVTKKKLLGEVRSMDGKILQRVIAKENGIFLYRHEAMWCQKGDDLYAYAYNKIRQ